MILHLRHGHHLQIYLYVVESWTLYVCFCDYDGKYFKSVEVYRPSDRVWTSIAEMELC